jgi:putative membrane protein
MQPSRYLLFSFLLSTLITVGLSGCNRDNRVQAAREDRRDAVSPAEQDFTMKAAQANLAEIQVARLAIERSQNKDVKGFADMLVKDHTSALEKLRNLMMDYNLPQTATLPADAKQEIDRLAALSEGDFDREFANMMVSDHQKAIELFHDEFGTAQNHDIREYVEGVLPKLEEHLKKAQELQSSLFNSAAR